MLGGCMLASFIEMMQYDFIQRAFFAGLIISICAALIGSSLVLRRQSMIGDGLSHVAFGAVAIAVAFGWAPLEFSIIAAIIAAFFILRLNENSKVNGDAAIAILSASALALGTFIVSIKGVNIDLNAYLFGSILAISAHDLIVCLILGVVIITVFTILHRQIFAITFDETFAKSIGIKVNLYQSILAILCAVTTVIGMKMLGALLISSLIIFPCLSAMQLSRTFRQNVVISLIISIVCFIGGLVASYVFATPTGATIVLVNLCVFLLCFIYNKLR